MPPALSWLNKNSTGRNDPGSPHHCQFPMTVSRQGEALSVDSDPENFNTNKVLPNLFHLIKIFPSAIHRRNEKQQKCGQGRSKETALLNPLFQDKLIFQLSVASILSCACFLSHQRYSHQDLINDQNTAHDTSHIIYGIRTEMFPKMCCPQGFCWATTCQKIFLNNYSKKVNSLCFSQVRLTLASFWLLFRVDVSL